MVLEARPTATFDVGIARALVPGSVRALLRLLAELPGERGRA